MTGRNTFKSSPLARMPFSPCVYYRQHVYNETQFAVTLFNPQEYVEKIYFTTENECQYLRPII